MRQIPHNRLAVNKMREQLPKISKQDNEEIENMPLKLKKKSRLVEPQVMPLVQVANRADEIIKLKQLMDKIFPNGGDAYLRLCIMAAIHDAYRQGRLDAIKSA